MSIIYIIHKKTRTKIDTDDMNMMTQTVSSIQLL